MLGLIKRIRINPFDFVYFTIAAATFLHSYWSGAFLYDGLVNQYKWFWVAEGSAIAIAVDYGMFLSAKKISQKFSWAMLIAYIMAALVSVFLQLVYSSMHTGEFMYSPGVSPSWQASLQPLMSASFVVVPFLLPMFSVVYTIANISHERNKETEFEKVTTIVVPEQTYAFHCRECNTTSNSFDTKTKLLQFARKHATMKHKIAADQFDRFAYEKLVLSE